MCSSDLSNPSLLASEPPGWPSGARPEAQMREGLDSIFTGLPQAECRSLRGMCDEDQERELAAMNFKELRAKSGAPSIGDLKSKFKFTITIQLSY